MNDATATGPGALVRAGRESRKLSQQDIADTLNLTLRVVGDIEAENWARLPPAAFTRGYLRAYARLLELDPDQVTRAFDATVERGAAHEEPVGANSTIRGHSATMNAMHRARRGGVSELLQKHPGAVLTSAVAVVICAVLIVLWTVWPDAPERSRPERSIVAVPEAVKPGTPDVAPAPTEPAAVAAVPESRPPPTTDVAEVAPQMEESADEPNGAQRISSAGEDRLSFVFSDNCWVEIKDAQGAKLYGDLGRAGTSVELVGQAPFRILLGNAPGVTLSFNGERVALSPHTRNNVGTLVLGQ